AILQMRPYSQKLQEMLSNIVSGLSDDMSIKLAEEREPARILLIPITSDRGTCGAYNSNVIKATKQVIQEKYQAQYQAGNVTILPVGKKGYEYFLRYDFKVVADFWNLFSELTFENVKRVAQYAQEGFLAGEYDKV